MKQSPPEHKSAGGRRNYAFASAHTVGLIADAPNGSASDGIRHAGRGRQVITEMLLIRCSLVGELSAGDHS
jgi:hypothetical protein